MSLVDQFGRPIEPKTLNREQGVADTKFVRNWAYYEPMRSVTPHRLARILADANAGDIYAQSLLFEEIEEKDTHIFAEISKRRSAVTGLTWQIQPGDDSILQQQLTDELKKVFSRSMTRHLLTSMADAIGKGFSCTEIIWNIKAGKYDIAEFKHRPQRWFQYGRDALGRPNTEIRLMDGTIYGEELIPAKWVVHQHPAKLGTPYRGALYRTLIWLYLFRNYDIKAWIQFVEAYGIPLRIGKYPIGSTETDKETLLRVVSSIATEAAVIIPETMQVEILDAMSRLSGEKNPHVTFLEWSTAEISKVILGSTLTSQSDSKGSYAMAKVHNDVRIDILQDDARKFEETINTQVILPWVILNYGEQEVYPYFRLTMADKTDAQADATVLKTLVDAGFNRIPTWWIRDKFGIPAPQKGDEMLSDLVSPPTAVQQNRRRELNVATLYPDQQVVDDAVAAITPQEMQAQVEPALKPVIEMIQQGASYSEAMEQLLTIYPHMDTSALEDMLARAIFVAEIWGRLNA